MYRRPIKENETALLNEMSRSTDPSREAREHLEYELEHGTAITRRAFVAELLRLRRYTELSRAARTRLPPRIRDELALVTKAKSYEHLVALATGKGADEPPANLIELEPGSDG
jgi:hypothetical protein